MNDVMALLKDRRVKAEGKVTRAGKVLEMAKKELADLIAAERVMSGITGESIESRAPSPPTSDRDREICKLLPVELDNAISPAELYPLYVEESGDNINLDTFRTALWRLQKRVVQESESKWTVKSENGRYWREPEYEADDDFDKTSG